MTGNELASALQGYIFDELDVANRIAEQAADRDITYREIRLSWDCVSVALDHNQDDVNDLAFYYKPFWAVR